nr:Amidophosphoribosyltransferase [Raoultella sp. NCTC 9187]
MAHNGNLTNAHELRKKLFEEKRRHINTTSDSEILLNIFASELDNFRHYPLEADNIFAAIAATNRQIRGAYACVGDDYRPRYGGVSRSERYSPAGAGQA